MLNPPESIRSSITAVHSTIAAANRISDEEMGTDSGPERASIKTFGEWERRHTYIKNGFPLKRDRDFQVQGHPSFPIQAG